MGVTKSDLFSERQNQLAAIARVLAHPARIAILDHLVKTNTCINGDLVLELGLAQATISQHLKELKASGLIKGSIEGVSVCYCINTEKWEELGESFQNFFKKHGSCC